MQRERGLALRKGLPKRLVLLSVGGDTHPRCCARALLTNSIKERCEPR